MAVRFGSFVMPIGAAPIVVTGIGFQPRQIMFRAVKDVPQHALCVGVADDHTGVIVNYCTQQTIKLGEQATWSIPGFCIDTGASTLAVTSFDPDGFTLACNSGAASQPVMFYAQS